MSEILREIDEELQQDRLKELWKKYGLYAVVALVAILLGAGGFSYWRNAQISAQESAADAFIAAQQMAQEANFEASISAFDELVQHGPEAYALLARFQRAAIIGEAGDRVAAGDAYRAIASDGAVEPLYQELALLMMAMQMADIGDAGQLIDQLRPISATGKPWRYSALEMIAALQLKQNDVAAATETLTELADALEAPNGARARAAELLQTFAE